MAPKVITDAIKKKILKKIVTAARQRARAACPSKTLRRAMQIQLVSQTEARIHIPHYWAVFYHDGRGSIVAKGKKLIYFANPADDPRLSGGFPVTRGDIRHLSKAEYDAGLKKNSELRGTGRVHMYVLDSVGPMQGTHFFDEGMKGFVDVVNRIVKKEIGRAVQTFIDGTSETKTIVIEL